MKTKSETTGEKKVEGILSGGTTEAVAAGPTHEEIQKRAYEIHLERGGEHGQDFDDWLEAERGLKAKRAAG
jgi:hypothetical protein